MRTVGIVAEYNPFHNGHKYHIEESRRRTGADNIIVIMSGNFVQRGEPAVFDKWIRAENAVKFGADLVIELPVVFSCSGAEFFAKAAVKILSYTGIVDGIAFGAEESSIAKLKKVSEIFSDESDEFKNLIKENLKNGMSYASARSRAAEISGMEDLAEVIKKPNNILGIEYLKQLNLMKKSEIEDFGFETRIPKPVLIERKSSGYYEENSNENIAGAGRLRELMRENKDISKYIPEKNTLKSKENDLLSDFNMKRQEPCFSESMYEFLLYKLVTTTSQEISRIDGVVEGIENRIKKSVSESIDYESLLDCIKSKRYSRTSIQRMLTKILLGITKSDMNEFSELNQFYGRVLAFNEKGAQLIRKIKKINKDNERIKMITNINRESPENPILKKMLEYDIKASDIYDILTYGRIGVRSDYRMKPRIVDVLNI